ncbi:MAG: ABC transporter permease subunit [Planctomycetota bacterium]
MPVQLLTIARNTFVESIRQPVYFVILLLAGLLMVFTAWGTNFSMEYTDAAGMTGDDKLLLDVGLGTVFVCGMLLAAFVATAVLSREIENKTVLTVVSKPISRTAVILGKYLGVSVAIVIAVVIMLAMLMLAVRHGVLSNASDTLDQPVIVFSGIAVGLSLIVGGWCNFYYGWHFAQTATLTLLPSILAAFVGVAFTNADWQVQHPLTDVRIEVLIACYCLTLAILVLTAVATAVSTRLGQVMTIFICAAVFVFGLLNNHFFGRHAYENSWIGTVATSQPRVEGIWSFSEPGDQYRITLVRPPTEVTLQPGTSIYFGPYPSGTGLLVPPFPAFEGEAEDTIPLNATDEPGRVVVASLDSDDGQEFFIEITGTTPISVERPPRIDDYIFTKPTKAHPVPLALWGLTPNMQFFWLLDAVSQNRYIPMSHAGMVTVYAFMQIGAMLSIAIVLFQKRDVG